MKKMESVSIVLMNANLVILWGVYLALEMTGIQRRGVSVKMGFMKEIKNVYSVDYLVANVLLKLNAQRLIVGMDYTDFKRQGFGYAKNANTLAELALMQKINVWVNLHIFFF